LTTFLAAKTLPATVFINELHYDNDGSYLTEAIEIVAPVDIDLTAWS